MQFTIAAQRHSENTEHAGNRVKSPALRTWAAQGLLAAVFVFAGISKLVMPATDLTANTWLSAEFLRFIGVCEVLGAAGLVLPGVFRIRRELTSLAAMGLVLIMTGATVVTVAAGDIVPAVFPLLVGLLCFYVARTRGRRAPGVTH